LSDCLIYAILVRMPKAQDPKLLKLTIDEVLGALLRSLAQSESPGDADDEPSTTLFWIRIRSLWQLNKNILFLSVLCGFTLELRINK
jgi:hypothetical protein